MTSDIEDPKMLPGEEPYTPEELEKLHRLMRGALEAEELFDLDELEEWSRGR